MDHRRGRRRWRRLVVDEPKEGRRQKPPFSRDGAQQRRLNGRRAQLADDLDAARKKYEGFQWGRKPRKVKRVPVSPPPRTLAKLGQAEAIVYSTKKGREKWAHYEHAFGEEGGRKPVLAVDPETDRLHLVGGSYRVEDRGIVD
jgi:hypothetical protein